jgi:hypothetical protein
LKDIQLDRGRNLIVTVAFRSQSPVAVPEPGRQAGILVMSKPAPIPRRGQIWEVTDGCDAQIQYLFTAPITFSGSCKLAAGERVCIATETTDPQAAVVSFLPVRYDELHDSLVPPDIRDTPRYKEYTLSVMTEYFSEHFRLVEDV